MKQGDLGQMPCPIARGVGRVGDSWSMLILRDAFYGMTRFDEFQKSLGIAPNILTRRLQDLVTDGMLQAVQYQQHPSRNEYQLTELGLDFRPVLLAMLDWGNRHFFPEGKVFQLIEKSSGRVVETQVVDKLTKDPISRETHAIQPGPMASDGAHYRIAYMQQKNSGAHSGLRFNPPVTKRDPHE